MSKRLGWLLAAGGGLGTASAAALTIEKFHVLANPGYVPSCSINPIVSCGSVMTSAQAEVFGFPNPVIGLAAFPVVLTLGVLLIAKVPLPRWVMLGLNAGAALGVLFVHWLIFQSLYRIGALCPYCMVVWVVTITMFWYLTLHNFRLPVLRKYHSAVLTVWFLVIIGLIGEAFWDYWRTLLL
ncbi:vitamin K epoxide reductase family protein [Longispora albida]|uniref:vitamin K epoxide reductase family protein n=1 Tax=Longispora albida TaxID=203523 RepID=UPI00037D58BC|nr:vitamin K epoxide reductase family protein [Longispora albida]